MTGSEVRAACKRMTNCSFAQEDAKRDPKATCYPSSSKQQPHQSNGDSSGTDRPASSSWSLKREPLPSLQHDSKWWLYLHPNFDPEDAACERLSVLDKSEDGCIPTTNTLDDEKSITAAFVESEKKYDSFGASWKYRSVTQTDMSIIEMMSPLNDNLQHQISEKGERGGCWCGDEDLMDWKIFDQIFPKKPGMGFSELETSLVGTEKNEPWWRTADKDELASLVAQKSLRQVENCDLPRPLKMRFPLGSVESVDDKRLSLEPALQGRTFCELDGEHKSCASGSTDLFCETGHGSYGSEKPSSTMHSGDPPGSNHHDPSKAELLEALCHSQTRAREAEMAAQKAYSEKEHTLKLFFRQASHMFAYKQWIRMLQLESFLLQLKLKEHQISSLFPVLPWSSLHGSKFGCRVPRKAKRRGHPDHRRCRFCKFAVALAVGFGLAGVGLLLGWSFGCLLPAL